MINVFEMAFNSQKKLSESLESNYTKIDKKFKNESKNIKSVSLNKIKFTEDVDVDPFQVESDIMVVYNPEIDSDMSDAEAENVAKDLIGDKVCKCGICGAQYICKENEDDLTETDNVPVAVEEPSDDVETDADEDDLGISDLDADDLAESFLYKMLHEDVDDIIAKLNNLHCDISDSSKLMKCLLVDLDMKPEEARDVAQRIIKSKSINESVDDIDKIALDSDIEDQDIEDTDDVKTTETVDEDTDKPEAENACHCTCPICGATEAQEVVAEIAPLEVEDTNDEEKSEAEVKDEADVEIPTGVEDDTSNDSDNDSESDVDSENKENSELELNDDLVDTINQQSNESESTDETSLTDELDEAFGSSKKQQEYEEAIKSVFGDNSTKVAFNIASSAQDALFSAIEEVRDTDRTTIDTKRLVSTTNKYIADALKGIKKDSTLGLYTVIQLCKKLLGKSDNSIDELEEARRNIHKLNSVPNVGSKAVEYLYSKINPTLVKKLEEMSAYIAKNMGENIIRKSSANKSAELKKDILEVDERSFGRLITKFAKENYSNALFARITDGRMVNGELVLEGNIRFNSGKTRKFTFISEGFNASADDITSIKMFEKGPFTESAIVKYNRVPFVVECNMNNGVLKFTGLKYNYTVKENKNSFRVFGHELLD